jgi:hypothetical protein
MSFETLLFSRRHVLGDLYNRCDRDDSVPVFMEEDPDTQIGLADQSTSRYVDAFSFHLPAAICKKLSSGQFAFSFGYAHAKSDDVFNKPRIRLTYICLTKIRPVA